ncbi:MAG: hypothetical protein H5U36_01805 [Candidatus Caldatribacterium sp.]|nr:hypothetical protein [Candidatus Caldatribacterium sp.]
MKFLARMKRFMEPLSIVLIIFGIFSLCQPFTFFLYHYGFAFLSVGTGLYILFSHIPSLEDLLGEKEA